MAPERRLLVLYIVAFVCGLVSSASLAIPWLYWDPTLDSCIDINCGCILYTVVTFSSLVGGAGWLCRFAVFVQLPVLLWATCAALYHAYRIWIPAKPPARRRTVTFHEDGTRKPAVWRRTPPRYYVLSVVALVVTVSLFAQAWNITAGYYATCRTYRQSVSQMLNANGNLAELVFERMSCGSILDFLDYLQPDPPLLPERYRRTYTIHSAYYLQIALVSSWADSGVWLVIFGYNIYLAMSSTSKT
uniref:Uncharacterized protein n=1 Tax=Graphocephala atropunctata TaxID=36148 RepID=A0A1B6KZV4_9HEMI